MIKEVGYKEPAGYFNADMKKEAEKWEKEQAEKNRKATNKKSNTGKKK